MNAWLFQDHRQRQKLGEKAPWSVGWIDPDGKRRSKTIGSHSAAEKFQRKVEGQLAAGTYQSAPPKQWLQFRKEYEQKIADGMKLQTRECTLQAIDHFQRIIKPAKVQAIRTATVDEFIRKRRTERGRKKDSTVSPATINKELRHIKSVLRVAHDWGYLPVVPKFRMVKEPVKLIRYVTPEHFAAIYKACNVAVRPEGLPYSTETWWQALLVFNYMTGWRISEPLALRREDLDLESGTAITRHADNKGGRDELVPLHPVVIDHLKLVQGFEPVVFPWHHDRSLLWTEFGRIQDAAGIHLECREEHEHTDACHRYGFHDLRRAFATANAETLTASALQSLMRHKSFTTTQKYVNMAKQLNRSVEKLAVPDILKRKAN